MRLPMDLGIGHYDEPPPEQIDDLETLRNADRFRFANNLAAWIEVDGETVIGAGYSGGGMIGATTVTLGGTQLSIPAVAFPDIQHDPIIEAGRAIFAQTAGGRTGSPMPRRVDRPPFVQITAPTAWTTLTLTIEVDGTSSFELSGASPFPRHWIYDTNQHLAAKSGITDFSTWSKTSFGDQTPWGDVDSPTLVTEVESALERTLSTEIMRSGARPEIRRLDSGQTLTRQGDSGEELYLILDGVLSVEVDDESLTEIGPGAVVGERALFEGGNRTSTLTAVTAVKVAVARPDQIDHARLRELSEKHRREEASR